MSKVQTYSIPCPKCKMTSEQIVFHSINTTINNVVLKLINNEINFAHCPHCDNNFQIKTGILFNNMEKSYAIYYNPSSFDLIDKESKNLKRMLGDSYYLGNPLKFDNWNTFIDEVKRKEGIVPKIKLQRVRAKSSYADNYWTCDICGGNSETGCLYFDPTECPRH